MTNDQLSLRYETHERVRLLRDVLTHHLEEIALEFDHWEEPHVHGPGMYIAVVSGSSVESYADPMGDNRWPADGARDPLEDPDRFASAAKKVAHSCDGAVVVSVDGIANRQLVRFRNVGAAQDVEYAPWMGSRHMSALDVSTRVDVVVTLTLSQESGRVTTFEDGGYESVPRDALGGRWRPSD